MWRFGGRASPDAWREPLLGRLVNFAQKKYVMFRDD